MKKFMLILVVLSLIGCSNPAGESEPEVLPQGKITITDIPSEYNGKYAIFVAERSINDGLYEPYGYAYGYDVYNGINDTYSVINNNICILPLWTGNPVEPYTGNDTFYSAYDVDDYRDIARLHIKIYDHQNYRKGDENTYGIQGAAFASVTFKKGNATLSWNDNIYTWDSDYNQTFNPKN